MIPLQRGQPSTVMKAFAADYHLFIESLYNSRGGTDEGGWTPTNSVATSNHLGGTAMDFLNWTDHPFHAYETFSREQQDTIHEVLDYYEDVIEWGGECWNGNPRTRCTGRWLSAPTETPRCRTSSTARSAPTASASSARATTGRVSSASPSCRRKAEPTGPTSPSTRGSPVDDTYPYSIICFRTNSGDKEDTLVGENCAAALRGLEANAASIVMPYYFFRPGEANCDLHREILQDHGLWLHPHTVTMVDVESDGGKIKGDQSWEVNDEVNRFVAGMAICGAFVGISIPILMLSLA